jgi:2-amino-4-hydroxy-6-hydroxymethyldihydropteridine pyrophosphokinase
MSRVFLGLGSNLGDKREYIRKALVFIGKRVGEIIALSDFYETQAWGYDSSETYINAVAEISTSIEPDELLLITQEIEREIGRKDKTENGKYHDRIIDIDILLYDDKIIQSKELTIPHPYMHKREFVLKPLFEIAPNVVHPITGKTISELCNL